MSGETNQVKWRGVQQVEGISGIWPARNAVRVAEQNVQIDIGTTIVYTVPAEKKLFISNAGISTTLASAVACRGYVAVRDGDDVTKYFVLFQQMYSVGQLTNFMGFVPALEAAAGWDVFVNTDNADLRCRGFVFGWLEDA